MPIRNANFRRVNPFACIETRQSDMMEEEPQYGFENPDDGYAPIKKKKKRYLPGERLLRKLDKKEKNKTLDMSMIHRSISSIIDDLSK